MSFIEISKIIAQNIVDEMKKIIKKDLNFIKINGEILASTNKKRIGNFHEGALKALNSNKTVVIDWDEQYPGSKKGVNIPVKLYDETIGVIGISGDKEEVEKYGEIIKRMTEILIKEAFILKKEERDNENDRLIIETLLNNTTNSFIKNTIISKEIEKIEKSLTKTVIVSKIDLFKDYDYEIIKKVFNTIKTKIKKNLGYLLINQNIVTIILLNKKNNDIKKIIDYLKQEIESNENIKLYFGIGEIKINNNDLITSYTEALNSLEWCLKDKKEFIFYENLDLEILLNKIDNNTSLKYKNKIFKTLSNSEICEYKNIFFYYEKYNGSLKKISSELFMHINTLQYKLNKFTEKTNLDIRNYKDFSKIKLAFMIFENFYYS